METGEASVDAYMAHLAAAPQMQHAQVSAMDMHALCVDVTMSLEGSTLQYWPESGTSNKSLELAAVPLLDERENCIL